jgi:hypothetical protein
MISLGNDSTRGSMKNLLKIMMIAGLLTLGSIAGARQAPQTASGSASSLPSLENGSLLYAELSKTVDTKKAKAGDPVTAQLVADVLSHGKIVIRRDSKLVGHVTEAQPYSKEKPESRLGIVFEKIILKGGQEVPFDSVLMSLRPAQSAASPSPSPAPMAAPGRDYSMPGAMPQRHRTHSASADNDAKAPANTGSAPSEMDGLILTAPAVGSMPTIISQKRTVKLESGVVIELRVTGTPGQ